MSRQDPKHSEVMEQARVINALARAFNEVIALQESGHKIITVHVDAANVTTGAETTILIEQPGEDSPLMRCVIDVKQRDTFLHNTVRPAHAPPGICVKWCVPIKPHLYTLASRDAHSTKVAA